MFAENRAPPSALRRPPKKVSAAASRETGRKYLRLQSTPEFTAASLPHAVAPVHHCLYDLHNSRVDGVSHWDSRGSS
jgi:hypothetical protein